ncbi:Acyl-CoA N-acyltransferases (Nat) [Glarea lozoyensis ATCC 20868]|uniref:Acyl-CoA N-acyltransferases (Nat) n=1 Tax=Glarea lozoyensis (strain ATCC 20868 / MF5171) TaxID=1116229 RepID=S3CEV8_GLAL2|nr:Acyl-CoA N-acyltransferases (Nat) [Glarea lozoyensis ATCC 20868]EPE24530.1 Acyl-CoA N-acyltransferases (Nat) [Glarea lozoyensis ATCC 20868]
MHSTTDSSPTPPTQQPTKKISYELRPATPADATQISQLGSKTFAHTFGYSLPPSDLASYLETSYSIPSITRELTNPSMQYIVAVSPSDASQIYGFAQLTSGSSEPCIDVDPEKYPEPVELQRLYVGVEFAGKGVGKGLAREIERMAREMGRKTLWLGVWEDNLVAQGIYKALGFEKVGKHDFVMGECVQTDWIMMKKL